MAHTFFQTNRRIPATDVNARDGYGKTALHFAAESGQLEVVKWLAE
jgi:ankyrin repeat protein